MKAGVLTGDLAWALLKHAKDTGYAIPAINCTSSNAVNSCLAAANTLGRPVIIQFSEGGSASFTGKGLPNESGVLQSSILGAVVGAHYLRQVSPVYGIPVLVNTDVCAKKSLPWLDGMLEVDEMFFKSHGEPLFSSHSLDFSEDSRTENVGTCATYLKKMAPLNLILEMEIGIVENGISPDKFYSTPENVWTIWEALAPISQKFTISAVFKNAKLSPGLLNNFQVFAAAKVGQPQPYFFSCHGGSGWEKHEIDAALKFGVVKINVGTDTLYAYCESHESEPTMGTRVKEACVDLKNTNGQPSDVVSMAAVSASMTEIMAELKETATKLCAPGKGFLAADESAGPWLRAGHADAAKIPDTLENRAAYRSMCFSTPGLSEYISGVILHWETLFQADATGKDMVKIITENSMIPGSKVERGYNRKGSWSTEVGPL